MIKDDKFYLEVSKSEYLETKYSVSSHGAAVLYFLHQQLQKGIPGIISLKEIKEWMREDTTYKQLREFLRYIEDQGGIRVKIYPEDERSYEITLND